MLFKLRLHTAIYRLRFYSNSLTHILSLSNSHSDVAPIQKNRDDKMHCVIVALTVLMTANNICLLILSGNFIGFWKGYLSLGPEGSKGQKNLEQTKDRL